MRADAALEALQRIAALYAIEAAIRGQLPDARLAARTVQSAPLFIALRQWLEGGGRVWVMLDLVEPEVVAPLLGNALEHAGSSCPVRVAASVPSRRL